MYSEFENGMPIYLQIVEQIKMDIVSGRRGPGERLPSVREWAVLMRVNPNTVQKALSELEQMQLIFTERTNGKFVTLDQDLICFHKKELAQKMTVQFLDQMKRIGFDEAETLSYLENMRGEKK